MMPLEAGQGRPGQVVGAVALVVDASPGRGLRHRVGPRHLGPDELPLSTVGRVPMALIAPRAPRHRASPWPPRRTASCQRMSWSMGRSRHRAAPVGQVEQRLDVVGGRRRRDGQPQPEPPVVIGSTVSVEGGQRRRHQRVTSLAAA